MNNEGKPVCPEGGEDDSSDDEDNKYFELSRFNDYGRDIKNLLKHNSTVPATPMTEKAPSSSKKWVDAKAVAQKLNEELAKLEKRTTSVSKFGSVPNGVLLDPVLGMHIVNPVVSSSLLKEKMIGRIAVSTLKIKNFVETKDLKDVDWVTGGVVISKFSRTSQKGNQYCVWNLTDLHGDIKLISVFFFGSAYKEFWKTPLGTVVGILNPVVMDSKESKIEVTLKVDNAQKVMVFGMSKDFGTCKSKKKNGEDCTAVVNKFRCEYCVYHVKQAYSQASRRSELQSACAGRGLNSLRNKILGKNEVFYAGKSFTAIPNQKNIKKMKKDEDRLKKLSEPLSKLNQLASAKDQGILDRLTGKTAAEGTQTAELSSAVADKAQSKFSMTFPSSGKCLNIFSKPSSSTSSDTGKTNDLSSPAGKNINVSNRFSHNFNTSDSEKKGKMVNLSSPAPRQNIVGENMLTSTQVKSKNLTSPSSINSSHRIVSTENVVKTPPQQKVVDLSSPVSRNQKSAAKQNALKFIKQHGPLKRQSGSNKKSPEQILALKRRLETENEENVSKKFRPETETEKTGKVLLKEKLERSGITDEFLKLMNASTKHQTLLKQAEEEEREKYFNKLEIREKIEDKMASTFKVECKAVRCLKCNYKSFSASDLCKAEKHPLKVVNAVKRFWKCGDCSARTVCLELVPLHSCKVCSSSKWERTSMMPEKKGPNLAREALSIRGHEESFIGAVIQNPNLNLLVPDESS